MDDDSVYIELSEFIKELMGKSFKQLKHGLALALRKVKHSAECCLDTQ